jgi:hypothetical protein
VTPAVILALAEYAVRSGAEAADLARQFHDVARVEDLPEYVTRVAGHDTMVGHDELHHYWTVGEGRAKWVDSPKPWTTLVALLTKHVGPEKAKVFASRWFIEVKGYAAGSDKNRVAHGRPPRGHRVGPG